MQISMLVIVFALQITAVVRGLDLCAQCPGQVGIPTETSLQTDIALLEYTRIVYGGLFNSTSDIGITGCPVSTTSFPGMATVRVWQCSKVRGKRQTDCNSDGDTCCNSCLDYGYLYAQLPYGAYPVNFELLDIFQVIPMGFCGSSGQCPGTCTQQEVVGKFLVSSTPVNSPMGFFFALLTGQIYYLDVPYPGYCKCV